MDGPGSAARLPRPRGSRGSPAALRAALEASLADLYPRFAAAGAEGGPLSRAAEWLLDNTHVVEGALRQVAEDLPERFCRSLPVLRDGAFQGQLRVTVLARQVCAAAGPLEIEQLRLAAEAFSPAHPLTIGELWALPALLRLELVENLVLTAEALLAGVSPSAQITDGTARIAACVLGLRTLATTDWKVFFERVSRVEHELRRDPAGVHARMDFETRDRYRREVEELARGSGRTEIEVARAAVELAGEAKEEETRAGHVGFYLLDRGRPLLERRLGYRAPPSALPGRWIRRHPTLVYLASIAAVALAVAFLPLGAAAVPELSLPQLIVLGALLLFPAGTIAASVVNLLVTLGLPPRPLPKMDFEEDLPDGCRTLVVVPAMLTSEEEVRTLIQDLEIRFLGNAGRNLGFALLSDFGDAPAREMPGDGELLRRAADGIRDLDQRYRGQNGEQNGGQNGGQRFFLLHRERRWNPGEGVWMGWERKRGKLAELNRLLAGDAETSYTTFAGGDLAAFGPVRFVLTLDADTFLPRGTAVRLAATLAHPLNQAEFDGQGRVAAGYTVLQPRVGVAPGGLRTRFARLFAGETGLDLYTRAVSDVFQDLFGIGIYAGKGIYEPVAFERSLAGRVPTNALLSHDLFEGLHGRAGLVSDVAVLEDYPPNLLVSLRRLHRWVRGDWQLLPWLLPRVPAGGAEAGTRVRNRLPLIGRWMILENLHRSLFAPALLALLVLGWLWLPNPWIWTLAGASTLALPILLGGLAAGWRILRGAPWGAGLADAAWSLRTGLAQALAALAVLPCEAFVIADAVLRTLARLATRRHLLEWMTAAHAVRRLGERRSGAYWRAMASAPVIAAELAVLVAAAAPRPLAAALPVLLLWGFSPQLAAWLGRSPAPRRAPLSLAERRRLRLLARRTWHFYERFVGPEDHWLPPDNYQEEPGGIVAHRTSPTNAGMLMLSVLTAYELGYVGADGMVARLGSLFATLEKLEGHRGHLWNWYDTRSLAALEPRYVSTVDSGNLAACLLAVAHGCRGAVPAPDRRQALFAGLADLLGVLAGLLGEAGSLAADVEGLARQMEQATEHREEVLARLERERLPQIEERILGLVETGSPPLDAARVAQLGTWIERVHHHLEVMRRARLRSEDETGRLRRELEDLAARAEARALGMDFAFLFDSDRQLFRIGYNASAGMPDPNHYDLLASEARIASLLAIGKGDVPQSHWVHLGRPFGRVGALRTLLSWGGTMFELLMPRLLMQHPKGTPLEESCRATVARQIAFGRGQGIPWGMSESGYAELDAHRNYRYRAFGVPGLGLKRDLGDRLVVAPYASLLALPFGPDAVLSNLERLAGLGALGRYGLFEALDFGPAPAKPGRPPKIVRSYMAHHQGMILAALGNALLDDALVRRFHEDPRIATVDLLLHEQMPRYAPVRGLPPPRVEAGAAPLRFEAAALSSWRVADGARPQAHVLSNGHYSVLVTSRGGGSSRWNGRVLVRGEADPAMERRGTRIYAEELGTGEVWSACGGQEGGEARFAMHMAELHSRHQGLSFRVMVAVSPSDDLEARLVFVVNETGEPRRLALTSYGEVVLAPSAEDRRHPAFGKLFVESEWAGDPGALCFRRRPRSPVEEPAVLAHTVVAAAVPHPEPPRWETDRQRFLGRGGGYRRPFALGPGAPGLSGTVGATLDPVFALRQRIDLPPFGEAEVAFLTAAGRSRDAVLAVLGRHRSLARVHEVFEQARIHAGPELGEAGVRPEAARAVQELLSAVLRAHPALRAGPAVLAANRLGQPGLWPYGISGDRPILVLRFGRREDSQLVREVLAAHALWRRRRVEIDLVILDENATVYEQPLAEWLDREIARCGGGEWRDRPGGIFVVRAALMQPADRTLLEAVAAAVLDASRGDLEAWLRPLRETPEPAGLPVFVPIPSSPLVPEPTPPLERPADLLFDNGFGGFMPGGRQYAIHLEPGRATPAPWSNVVANPGFGFLATESGGGFTWAVNSGENRLTPWRNDPVADTPGEALYLRDEETGEVWTVTRLPAGADAACQARHEAGATVYLQNSRGLEQELRLSVPREAPVKIAELRLANLWRRPRRITATYFAEWVLGASRQATAAHVVSEYDGAAGALLARCSFPSGGERTAFLAASRPPHGLTADRAEFLGTPADRVRPAGLARIGLAGAVGPGLDPCAALQVHFDLRPGETASCHFLLGQAADRGEALALAGLFREPSAVEAARREAASFWDGVLGSVRISTPEPEIDLPANRWLLHQALSCRIWGRSAFYQPSGAFGFRDQLQDVLALLHAAPEITRAHLLEAARHQFEAGDVLHWWHPPEGRGVRTRCSDDLLWLPYVVAGYLAATGDRSVLMEEVPFRTGPQLHPGEAERYDLYPESGTSASLYEHCLRAIHRGTTGGPHGLPLIGAGDWNDGMNRVGEGGQGESVWLGWFLYAVLTGFAPVCEAMGDAGEADRLRRRAGTLRQVIEASAWDGDWYLRAWYDDGTPLGSAANRECRIDLLAQAWAVLSQAADPPRGGQAMDAAWRHLVRPEEGLTLLLAPPFDRTRHDPGYIKGYPPGVRENGGQYSHAAVWAAWAFARLGDGDRAMAVLRTVDPVYRTATPEGAERYRVEPYAVAGDVAGAPPHAGRGGWTWYTGTAAWTWRLIVEAILGLRRAAGVLEIDPCIPRSWPGFEAEIREGKALYRIRVENPDRVCRGVKRLTLDGQPLAAAKVRLADDGQEHEIAVQLGEARSLVREEAAAR